MEGLITMHEAIEAIQEALQEAGAGRAFSIPRGFVQFQKKTQPDAKYYYYHMAASIPSNSTMCLRLDSRTLIAKKEGERTQEDLGGDFIGLVLLFDTEDNKLKAILHDDYLSPIRVAATSGLVARFLARKDSKIMGLFGAGPQAKAHLEVISEVRPISLVRVFTPYKEERELFASEFGRKFQLEIEPCNRPEDAVLHSDIVVAATNSNSPVFKGEWLNQGTHVVTIRGSEPYMKQWETDETTARRANFLVLNSSAPIREGHLGLLPLLEEGALRWQDLWEITDLVLGRSTGRKNDNQITVHYNNIGLGIQWAAIGHIIYKKARDAGIGTAVPLELFMTRK
jgi:ornithine cyclodeaminase